MGLWRRQGAAGTRHKAGCRGRLAASQRLIPNRAEELGFAAEQRVHVTHINTEQEQ